ncbi:MAG: hypothetical protein ABSE76_01380 [Minisyncoccia bacterium]|jgi:hypothetical protein
MKKFTWGRNTWLLLIVVVIVLAVAAFGVFYVRNNASQSAAVALSAVTPNCTSKCIAMEYEIWFPSLGNGNLWTDPNWGTWSTPLLGDYTSTNTAIIDKHAEWLNDLGVNFVILDWTNSAANYVAGNTSPETISRTNTSVLFTEYQNLLNEGKPYPRIAITLAAQDEGSITQSQVINTKFPQLNGESILQNEADYAYQMYTQYPNIYYSLNGKPLLLVYTGIPTAKGSVINPAWNDSRFTVRFVSVFEQPYLKGLGNSDIWSWEDRNPRPSNSSGSVEAITVTQAYPGCGWTTAGCPATYDGVPTLAGRDGTTNASSTASNYAVTFNKQWSTAISYNPEIIILTQFNEWIHSDQDTTNFSNDLEPSVALGCGPMAAVQQAVAAWKGVTLPSINCSANLAPPLPTVSSFVSTPASVTQGQSITLSWSVSGATSLSISGIGAVTGTSVQVTPSQTTTYTLTASNAQGSNTAQVTVSVVAPNNIPPIGFFDSVSSAGVLSGWSLDPNASSTSVNVAIYADGPKGVGTLVATIPANTSRPDVDSVMHVTGNHGFVYQLPASYLTASHTLYAYGIDLSDPTVMTLLVGSPKVFPTPTTPAAPPTMTISAGATTLYTGQSTTIHATFTPGTGDQLLMDSINEIPPSPAAEIIGLETGSDVGTAVQNPLNFTFTPTTAGTYYFLPVTRTNQYPTARWLPSSQWVRVVVKASSSWGWYWGW